MYEINQMVFLFLFFSSSKNKNQNASTDTSKSGHHAKYKLIEEKRKHMHMSIHMCADLYMFSTAEMNVDVVTYVTNLVYQPIHTHTQKKRPIFSMMRYTKW